MILMSTMVVDGGICKKVVEETFDADSILILFTVWTVP